MASPFDESDFVDSDFQAAQKTALARSAPSPADPARGSVRPPSREEIDARVSSAQQKLAELRKAQEDLERERSTLEEARRRQTEFVTGREEMLQHLTRGIGLIEEAEFAARRDAEQMARTMADLRDALTKLQNINEEAWTTDNWSVELTRALTTIENARMEWNGARLKWPVLSGVTADASPEGGLAEPPIHPLLAPQNFAQLCRIGFAFTWPLVVLGLGIFLLLLLRQ